MESKIFKICYTLKALFLVAKCLGLVDDSLPLEIVIDIVENALPELLSFIRYMLPQLYVMYFSLREKYK